MSNTPDNNRPEPQTQLAEDRECSRPANDSLQIDTLIDDGVSSPVSEDRLCQAVAAAAAHCGFPQCRIGVRVTSDAVIHEINRKHLSHDYPTDVISFPYGVLAETIVGELVVSADTARRSAGELGWSACDELLLYVVHGTLHLAGMDDLQPDDRAAMRVAEREVMKQLGIEDILRFGVDQHESDEDRSRHREGTA